MLDPRAFRELVSERRRGPWAAALRAALRVAELPYTSAMTWRNRWYDRHPDAAQRVNARVISVGNLTLGGTGKTPMVEWLARWFSERGVRVAIISRGYKAHGGDRNDEAVELARRLPNVPHVQNSDRVAAANEAIEKHGAEVLLADDAFQHRRLARDLDVVLLDALEPFGFEHVFPRGTLREPPGGLRRAHVVVLSRADMIAAVVRERLRHRVSQLAPDALWLEAAHTPLALVNAAGCQQPFERLAGQPVLAFCGIGNPEGFQHTVTSCGGRILKLHTFPDHFAYRPADLTELAQLGERCNAATLVCTEKDLAKIGRDHLGARSLWALRIGLKLLSGGEAFEQRLQGLRSPETALGHGLDKGYPEVTGLPPNRSSSC